METKCRRWRDTPVASVLLYLEWWADSDPCWFFDTTSKGPRQERPPAMQLWNLTSQSWQQPEPNGRLSCSCGDQLCCLDQERGHLDPVRGGDGEVTIVHDPWRPAPAIGGHLSPDAGAADRRPIDGRSDVATFSSPPCLQPLTLQGYPQLSLEVHADQPGFDLCLALSRLPAGSDAVEQLSTGVLRQRGPDALKPQIRRVAMQPLLAKLRAGDRLRLSIAGAAWPAIGSIPAPISLRCTFSQPSRHCHDTATWAHS